VKDVNLNAEEWCDLVFEGRNKEYGAYELRKTSSLRHLFALFIVVAGTFILILLFYIIHFNQIKQRPDYEYEMKAIELSSLVWLDENNNNRVKAEEQTPLDEVAKNTAPAIVKDESIVQDQKEMQEINTELDSIDESSALEEDTLLSKSEAVQLNTVKESDTTAVDEKNRNAVFQDGKAALLRYIYQNIQYPSAALKQRINGRVVCSFIVNEDGSLSDVTLIQGVYIFLDEEVLRVVRSMPLWKPAMKDGKPVKIKYIMPVVFKLN